VETLFGNLIVRTHAGIDVGDEAVHYAVVSSKKGIWKLKKHGKVKLPKGVIVDGRIEDPKRLSHAISHTAKKAGIKRARVSLPESHGFVVKEAGIKPTAFELRGKSLARLLTTKGDKSASIIVNFGEHQTDIAVASEGKLIETYSLPIPDAPSDKILASLGVEPHEAKHTRGLSDPKLAELLIDDIANLVKAVNTLYIDWHTRDNARLPRIEGVILVGTNAHIKGLPEHLSQALKLPVKLGDPFKNHSKKTIPPIPHHEALGYSAAIGLALGLD
jgi:Tfp pilus assembly PilM family ATPase